jgi:hypothetical protein
MLSYWVQTLERRLDRSTAKLPCTERERRQPSTYHECPGLRDGRNDDDVSNLEVITPINAFMDPPRSRTFNCSAVEYLAPLRDPPPEGNSH